MPSNYLINVVSKSDKRTINKPRFENSKQYKSKTLETILNKPFNEITLNDLTKIYSEEINQSPKTNPKKICYEVAFETEEYHSVEFPLQNVHLLHQVPPVYNDNFMKDDIGRKFICLYW
jgi:hypothetical protein